MEQDTAAFAHQTQEPEPHAPRLAEDLRLLVNEAKVLAQAELAYQRSRARFIAGKIRTVVALVVLALVLLFFAAIALVVGLVFALAPVLTAWGATALVTLGLVVLAILCALCARRSLSGINAVIVDRPAKEPFA